MVSRLQALLAQCLLAFTCSLIHIRGIDETSTYSEYSLALVLYRLPNNSCRSMLALRVAQHGRAAEHAGSKADIDDVLDGRARTDGLKVGARTGRERTAAAGCA